MNPHIQDYERMLGALEGDDFEREVCARLAGAFADFQRIPRKPKGDAGLDGISHAQTRAYCCYGPEQEPFKTNTKGLKDDILKKFRSDLRKLFELDYEKKMLVCKPSVEMNTILAVGRKIKNVYLVVSVFETHRIIGPLNESFEEYKSKSSCTYVDSSAQPTVWGPTELGQLSSIDEHALFRVEHRALVQKVKQAKAAPSVVPAGDFDAKFDYLRAQGGASFAPMVDRLADHFRKAWGTALMLDNELSTTSTSLHAALEGARTQAAVTASIRSMQTTDPQALLEHMRDKVREHLGDALGQRLGPLAADVADGEVARLLGECPIDWRK